MTFRLIGKDVKQTAKTENKHNNIRSNSGPNGAHQNILVPEVNVELGRRSLKPAPLGRTDQIGHSTRKAVLIAEAATLNQNTATLNYIFEPLRAQEILYN